MLHWYGILTPQVSALTWLFLWVPKPQKANLQFCKAVFRNKSDPISSMSLRTKAQFVNEKTYLLPNCVIFTYNLLCVLRLRVSNIFLIRNNYNRSFSVPAKKLSRCGKDIYDFLITNLQVVRKTQLLWKLKSSFVVFNGHFHLIGKKLRYSKTALANFN